MALRGGRGGVEEDGRRVEVKVEEAGVVGNVDLEAGLAALDGRV